MPLQPADHLTLDALTAVYNRARQDYLVPMPMTPARLAAYVRTYDVDLSASVVALAGGQPAGLCLVGVRPGRGWITRLGVEPAARRRGLARTMLEACLREMAARGARDALLETIVGNDAACALFERAGFRAWRRLLVLRRAAGDAPRAPAEPVRVLSRDAILARRAAQPSPAAWTNQVESLAKVEGLAGLADEQGGWLCYAPVGGGLGKVIVEPGGGGAPAARTLLAHLHARYPAAAAEAENVPAGGAAAAGLEAAAYTLAFARWEMRRGLG